VAAASSLPAAHAVHVWAEVAW
jgi:hypothetical protein